MTLVNWTQYSVTSAFYTNSLWHCCCKPTSHCNKSHELGGVSPLL